MEKLTEYKDASSYNNFYEFGTDKSDPARNAHTPQDRVHGRWRLKGRCVKPAKYTLEDLLKLSAQEERIYRLRCVEGWSMVIPWVGYSLSRTHPAR
jgi:sulfoxide reductase catalytic subunit YedY